MPIFDQGVFGQAIAPQPYQQIIPPQLTPEEQDSLLSRIGSGALHGLGWIGGSFSKALGGRAIRGLAGMAMNKGTPASELLSVLPFSDTFGITNPENEVHGSDLLGGNKDTSFFSPEGIGGLGIDILTDPATYLSFGGHALTKLGTAAHKLGIVPKTGALRAAGFAAASPEAAALASHLTNTTGKAVTAAEVAGQALGGHVGIGFPFMGNAATFNLAPAGNALVDLASKIPGVTRAANAVGKVADPVRRFWGAGFNPEMMGQVEAKAQELSPAFFDARKSGQELGKMQTAELMRLHGAADMLTDPQGLRKAIETGAQQLTPKSVSAWHDAYQAAKAGGLSAEEAIQAADKISPQEWINTGSKLIAKAGEPAEFIGKNGQKYTIDVAPQLVKDLAGKDVTALRATAHDAQGNEVARTLFDRRGNVRGGAASGTDYTAGGLSVDPAHQGQGLANAMYDYVHGQLSGLGSKHDVYGRILPSADQTAAELAGGLKGGGKAIWEANAERALREAGTTGETSAGAQRAAEVAKKNLQSLIERRTFLGDNKEELANFFPRQAVQPELDLAQNFLSKPSASREKILLNNSVDSLDKMVRDPVIGTSARTAATDYEAANHLVQKYNVSRDVADETAKFLHSLDPARQKFGLFARDSLHDYMTHAAAGEARVNMLQELYPVLAKEAGPASSGSTSVPELLSKLGLSDNAQKRAYEALDQAGKLTSPNPGMKAMDFQNMHIPKEVANALGAILKPDVARDGEFVKLVKALIDVPSNLFRGHVTQPFPGFHERNAMTSLGWIQTVLTGSPKAAIEGNQMMTDLLRGGVIKGISEWPAFKSMGLNDAQVSEHVSNWLFSKGLTQHGSVADVLGHQAGPGLIESLPGMMPDRKVGLSAIPEYLKTWLPRSLEQANPLNMRGLGGAAESKFAPAAAGEKLATVIEQTGRGGGALALLKQGFAPDMAAAMTKAAHVDYSNLTGFEREVMRRLIPFYSWARGNIPLQLREIMGNPGGLTANALKASTRAEGPQPGMIPDYLGTGVIAGLGKTEDGKRQYLSQLGLPFEDLGNLSSSNALLGQLNPFLKFGIEQATGRQLMSGRDLADVRPLPGPLGNITPTWLQNLTMNTPLARYVTTGKSLADERNTWGASALNLLTGSRLTNVDPDIARRNATEQYVEQMLRGNPLVHRYQDVYVKAADRGQLTPAEAQLLQLYSLAQRNKLAK